MTLWYQRQDFPRWDKVIKDIVDNTNAMIGENNLKSQYYEETPWKWKIFNNNRVVARPRRRLKARGLRVNINEKLLKKAHINEPISGQSLLGDWGTKVNYFDIDISDSKSIFKIVKILTKIATIE